MNKIKKIALIGTIVTGIYGGMYLSSRSGDKNYTVDNTQYTRMTNPNLSVTEYTVDKFDNPNDNHNQETVIHGKRILRDGGEYGANDGLVDLIEYVGRKNNFITRDKDYETNKKEFHSADKILKKTRNRVNSKKKHL